MRKSKVIRDRHVLYEAAVQSLEADLDFFERVYQRKRGKRFERFREDFCGTAALSCDWVRRRPAHLAWGVDLHRPTLDWGLKHRVAHLGSAAERVRLQCADVLQVDGPKIDVVAALNFSFSVFKERDLLRRYFKKVRKSLLPGGIFYLDTFGGTETLGETKERRRIPSSKDWDGQRIPAFYYVWEQARFNPIDHEILCHIHFELPNGTKLRKAFTYDWRLWTLPELQELLLEAGFDSTEVYMEGWDEEAEDGDGIFRCRKRFENHEAWVAYVVGLA